MKYENRFGLPEPIPAHLWVRRALVSLFVFALSVSGVVVAGIAYAYGAELVGTSLPLLLAGWVASIGVAFSLPFLVVRMVSAGVVALEQ
ncbi:hypothetical protein [Haladaptatus sp. NG-WS-4]